MGTLKKQVKISGVGIHSGLPVNIVVKPSKVPGIYFQRIDIADAKPVQALFNNVGEARLRNTTIGNVSGAHVQTIEHLMAALFVCGIDSAVIEIDDKETPILDGSAAEFIKAFMAAGVTSGTLKRIVVRKKVVARAAEITRTLPFVVRVKLWFMNKISGRKSDGYVELTPNNKTALDIVATLIYPEKIIGAQTYEYSFDGSTESVKDFIDNIARARTFGKYSEWEYLKARGMGRGANENNVIALNDAGDGTLNKLLWKDEFVRHKIIDAIGDMYTSGGFINAKLVSYKGSHALNNLVLKKLFSDASNYDIIDAE